MNYPVTQAADNEYYLNRNFYKRRSVFGNPYFDYRNKIDGTDRNLIIYGHRVENGQMFGDMEKYKDLSYYQQHAAIQMDTVYRPGVTRSFPCSMPAQGRNTHPISITCAPILPVTRIS